jgi:hypothetical protein
MRTTRTLLSYVQLICLFLLTSVFFLCKIKSIDILWQCWWYRRSQCWIRTHHWLTCSALKHRIIHCIHRSCWHGTWKVIKNDKNTLQNILLLSRHYFPCVWCCADGFQCVIFFAWSPEFIVGWWLLCTVVVVAKPFASIDVEITEPAIFLALAWKLSMTANAYEQACQFIFISIVMEDAYSFHGVIFSYFWFTTCSFLFRFFQQRFLNVIVE